MRKKTALSAFLVATMFFLRLSAAEVGNSVLYILGKDKNSSEFQSFKETWGLNQKYESSIRGIKVFVNEGSAKVNGILFAGENFKLNDSKFVPYSSSLPFNISLKDNPSALMSKLGAADRVDGNTWRFNRMSVNIEVDYASNDNHVITSVKCYSGPVVISATPTPRMKDQPILMASMGKATPEIKKAVPSTMEMEKASMNLGSFKAAIMDVFKAYRESNFYNIKGRQRGEKNFFNYKYTYNSKLKIPGEQFSMLYSFPFSNSNLDYISILKESESCDKSFEATYHDFEKKLMETFPTKDGWVASCIANKESKSMSDLQFRNDRYGAVVLDYCRNPKTGKHILYMRFLLFSN